VREEKREKGREREEKFSFLLKKNEQASKQPFSRFLVFSFFLFLSFVGKKIDFSKNSIPKRRKKSKKKYGKPLAI